MTTGSGNTLGAFLRASRARLEPAAQPLGHLYRLAGALDVLATNTIAAALLSPFDDVSTGGTKNMIRILFGHPEARTVFAEWPVVVRDSVRAAPEREPLPGRHRNRIPRRGAPRRLRGIPGAVA
jgi:hypothetical protein